MSVLVQTGGHVGDRAVGVTVYLMFTCTDATGAPTTLGGTPAVSAYRDASTTESTAGVTLTVDFDGLTGLCHVAVDTTADASFYATAHDYRAVITAGTVGAVSVVGTTVGGFSLARATATLADAVAHGGAAATLQLGSTTSTPPFHVTNSGGDAVQFASSASGGNGLVATGGGGAKLVAGAGNGIGAWLAAATGSNSSGLVTTGNGTAAGFESQGGASGGHGINALGGSGGDADGIHALGFRGGAGVKGIGGDGALADNLGNGFHAVGGFSGLCHGIYAQGGRGDGSDGIVGTIYPGNTSSVGFLSNPTAIGFGSTYAGGPVASVTAPVTVGTVTDKAGYSLASTGLDSITVAAPTGPATTFPKMLVQIYRRFFKKSTMTSTQLKTYADDGTTVVTTQTLSDTGTTQTQGDAS